LFAVVGHLALRQPNRFTLHPYSDFGFTVFVLREDDFRIKRFVKESPISVMARGLMERAFNAEQMDRWFDRHADSQYTRDLLFSTIFDIMSLVVSGMYKSVHADYRDLKDYITVGWLLY